jgi:Mg2+/Co2+ transporter CorC
MVIKGIADMDGDKVEGLNAAKDLLKRYKDNFEVEEAPKVDEPKTEEEAQKEVEKLLK